MIEIMALDGSARHMLPTEGDSWYPRWSADGRWILYTGRLPDADPHDLDLFAIPADGSSKPILLAGGELGQSEGRWRP